MTFEELDDFLAMSDKRSGDLCLRAWVLLINDFFGDGRQEVRRPLSQAWVLLSNDFFGDERQEVGRPLSQGLGFIIQRITIS